MVQFPVDFSGGLTHCPTSSITSRFDNTNPKNIAINMALLYYEMDPLLCLRFPLLAVDLTEELSRTLGLLGRLGVDMPHLEHRLHHLGVQDAGHEADLVLQGQDAVVSLTHVLAQSLTFETFIMTNY